MVRGKNNGPVPASGTLILNYDPRTSLRISTIGNGFHDPINHSVSWYFSGLKAKESILQPGILLAVPSNLPGSDTLISSLRIIPDVNDAESDDNFVVDKTIVSNNSNYTLKKVDQPTYIQGDEWLTYSILFQNTTGSTLKNLSIHDSIRENLEGLSIQPLASSNPSRIYFEDWVLKWDFTDINLPDSIADPINSIGAVQFRIKPYDWLANGSIIRNNASVFYDPASPFETAYTLNIKGFPTGIPNPSDQPEIHVVPNPFQGSIYLTTNANYHDLRASLYDLSGKLLFKEKFSLYEHERKRLNLEGVPNGYYILELTGDGFRQVFKMMKRE
jgi:hypothetical protein